MIPSPGVIRLAVPALRVTPLPVARAVARAAGLAAWAALPGRRRVIMENLSHTAAAATPAQRRRLCRRTFTNMAEAAVHLFRLPSMSREELFALCEVEGREHLDAALAMGRGVIVVTPHLGPYELGSAWAAAAGYPVYGMVEDLAPEVLDALATYRTATGMQIISMKQGIRAVYRLLQQNKMVLLVADRAIGGATSAVTLPFAGGRRPLPTGPATFSAATGAPVVVGSIFRNPRRSPHYRVRFLPPLVPEGRSEAAREHLQHQIVQRLGDAVRDHPDQWYVFQPQWVAHDGA